MVDIRVFVETSPVVGNIFYSSVIALTAAEMKEDIFCLKDEILSTLREFIQVPDNLLDRMDYIVHLEKHKFIREKRDLVGQYVGVSAVMYDIK